MTPEVLAATMRSDAVLAADGLPPALRGAHRPCRAAREPTFVTAMADLAPAAVKPGWMLSRAERMAAVSPVCSSSHSRRFKHLQPRGLRRRLR